LNVALHKRLADFLDALLQEGRIGAAGHNLRLLIAWLNALLRALLTAWLPVARREMTTA
jgi:hypothetical protein